MLEIAPHDGADPDPLGETGHPGTKATDAPHDQVDARSLPGRRAQLVDELRIRQPVHFHDDAGVGLGGLISDQLDHRLAKAERGHQELPVRALAAVPREVVEQIGDVGAQVGVGAHQPDVLVQGRRGGVVVPRPDMAVPDPVGFAPDHHRDLGVRLEPDHAVHDVDTSLFQDAGPGDVRFLVEPGLELDQSRHLLAGLGSPDERTDDAALATRRSVKGLLDRQDPGIPCRLLDEALHRGGERVVWVLHQDVAVTEHPEQTGGRVVRAQQAWLGDRAPRLFLELRSVQFVQGPQPAEVQQALDRVDIGRFQIKLPDQEIARRLGHRHVHLEPDGVL